MFCYIRGMNIELGLLELFRLANRPVRVFQALRVLARAQRALSNHYRRFSIPESTVSFLDAVRWSAVYSDHYNPQNYLT